MFLGFLWFFDFFPWVFLGFGLGRPKIQTPFRVIQKIKRRGKSKNQSFFTWIKKFYLKRLIFGILEFRFHLVAEFRRPVMKKSKRFQKSSCFREQTPRTPYVFSHFPHNFSTLRMCSYSHQQDQHYSHFFLAASVWSYNRFGDVRAAMSRVLKATQVVHFVHDYGSIQPQTHATSGFDPNMNAKYKESSYIQTRHTWGSSHAHNELLTSQALYNEPYTGQYNPAIDGAEVSRQNAPSQPHNYSVKLVEQPTEPHMTMLSHTTPVLASWRREPHQKMSHS